MNKSNSSSVSDIFLVGIFILCILCGLLTNYKTIFASLGEVGNGSDVGEAVANLEKKWNTDFVGKTHYVDLNGLLHKVFTQRKMNEVVILDNGHGSLLFTEYTDEGIISNADSMQEFSNWCADMDVDFLYLQVPYKNEAGNSQLPPGAIDYSNDVADKFLAELKSRNVDYLDIRKCIADDDMDFYSLFLKNEHHWSPYGGFYAFTKLCEYFSSKYGDTIDLEVIDISNYNQITVDKKSSGYYTARTGAVFMPPDEYTLIYPKFETQQSCYITHKDETRTGSFYDAVFDMEAIKSSERTGLYGTYIGGDYAMVHHESETAKNNGAVVLFIDSFGTILESYLTTVYRNVYAFDLRWIWRMGYTESAAYFVETLHPDHVVVALNPNQIGSAESEQFDYFRRNH